MIFLVWAVALLGFALSCCGVAAAYLLSQHDALVAFGVLLILFYWATLAQASKVLS